VTTRATTEARPTRAETRPSPRAISEKPFDAPQPVPGLDDRDIYSARLSADETSALLAVASGQNGVDLYAASRASPSDPFVVGAPIAELDTAADEYWPSLGDDGKMIFFESGRSGVARIWTASRPSADAAFGAPFVLGIFEVDGGPEAAPYLHPGGRSLYFSSLARGGKGDLDLFVAAITDFGVVTAVRSVDSANSALEENMPLVSYDERALFFSSSRVRTSATTIRYVTSGSPAETVALDLFKCSYDFDDPAERANLLAWRVGLGVGIGPGPADP
jgi:hypothetical protein